MGFFVTVRIDFGRNSTIEDLGPSIQKKQLKIIIKSIEVVSIKTLSTEV